MPKRREGGFLYIYSSHKITGKLSSNVHLGFLHLNLISGEDSLPSFTNSKYSPHHGHLSKGIFDSFLFPFCIEFQFLHSL